MSKRKKSQQLSLPGMNPTPSIQTSKAAKVKRADIVLVQALEAHSLTDLQAAIEALRPQKDSAGFETAYRLVAGVIAYRIARDAKQESFL